MVDGPSFPRNPLAGRDAAFRDADGHNPFRDADELVEAEAVESDGTGTGASGSLSDASPYRSGSSAAYSVAGAPGVRRPRRGDFEPTLPSQANALVAQATICLVTLALAWFMLILVVLLFGGWGWAAFFLLWFGLTGFVGLRCVVVARGEQQAIRLGAMADEARPNVRLAMILAVVVSVASLAGLIVGAIPILRQLELP